MRDVAGQASRFSRALDRGAQPIMWWASMGFLAPLACVVPQLEQFELPRSVQTVCLAVMLAMEAGFLAEWAVQTALGPAGRRQPLRLAMGLAAALIPPTRILISPATATHHVWLPWMGWRNRSRTLVKELLRHFSRTMLVFALLILPILPFEFIWSDLLNSQPWLLALVDVTYRLIWLAFAVEFLVIASASRDRIGYAIKHWVDLAIIILPLIAFLRVLRLVRVGRAARLGRMSRMFRLRGVGMRLLRALMVLRMLDRFSLWGARRHLAMLEGKLKKRHIEIEDLKLEIAELKHQIEQMWKLREERKKKKAEGT